MSKRFQAAMLPAAPRAILLVRLSAIGDLVMASPLIHLVRQRYPQAWIAWLAQSESAPLLQGHPELDEVIVWDRARWRRLRRQRRWGQWWKEWGDLRSRLRERRFDMVIDLQGLMKSAVWARVTGAPLRIGLDSREGSAWWMHAVIHSTPDDPRLGSEYRQLADTLGWNAEAFEPRLPLSRRDRERAAALLRENGIQGDYAVVCPFTTRPQKHWREAAWAALAQGLRQAHGWPVVMLGGPDDAEAARRIMSTEPDTLTNLVGETGLREAAAIIAGARVLIGVDTGLSHMAHAFEKPAVLLFGSTCPYRDPANPRAEIIYHDLDCAPCRRSPTCNGAFTCMTGIDETEVLAAVQRVTA